MSETAQLWIAAAIVGLAALALVRSALRAWRRFRSAARGGGSSCGGCGGCGGDSAASPPGDSQRVEMVRFSPRDR